MADVVIASAARTPVGRFLGSLSTIPAPELGAVAIRGAVERAGLSPGDVDQMIAGEVITAGIGMAPARQAALAAGLPATVPALTINKMCGSGVYATILAAQAIRCGDAEIVVAAGMESMSLAPHLLQRGREGVRLGDAALVDSMLHDGLVDPWEQHHMGCSAEAVARKHGISRQAQDGFALESHQRAVAAAESGAFDAELVPVEVPSFQRKHRGRSMTVEQDECPRADTSADALAKLRPAFDPEGTVTAGNSSALSDGGAALVVMSAAAARRHGVRPLARITGWANAAVEPLWIFEAPAATIRQLLERTGQPLDAFDLLEVNEAFAAQVLTDERLVGWDPARLNVHGGAIALGHPLGCSGARILTTLVHALHRHDGRHGLAAACLGGGEAVAISIERVV